MLTLAEMKKLRDEPPRPVDAEWIASSGETPLEFLVDVYRDSALPLRDRMSAAKSVLEYSHKKVPSESAVNIEKSLKLDPTSLKSLNDEEIDTLLGLLSKIE